MKVTIQAYVHGIHIDTFVFGVDETKSTDVVKHIDLTHLFRHQDRCDQAFRQQLIPFNQHSPPTPPVPPRHDHA